MTAIYFMHSTKTIRLEIDKQSSALNLDQNILKIASFGQKRMIADLLWVQTLMESDLEHYAKRDLSSWMYLRFKSIADLDPRFYENYLYGGQYLMIVKDDIPGAEKILVKGAALYPNDYKLNFNTGFLYAMEIGDLDKALNYYIKIKDSPERPFNFDSFLAKVMSQTLGPEDALNYSIESLKRTPEDSPLYTKIKDNIYALKAQIDLECLNNSKDKTKCSSVDYLGDSYIYQNGSFTTKHKRTELKLKFNR